MFEQMEPNARVHTLVAYKNLIPLISVDYGKLKEQGDEFSIESWIHDLVPKVNSSEGDEVNYRRLGWFLTASFLARMEKLSVVEQPLLGATAKVWLLIANDASFLKRTLPNNVIWDEEEKAWFDLNLKDEQLVEWTINHVMPPLVASHESVKEFARARGLFYWPSKSRIGFVP